ncbi:MAG: helix-hairpin-helix domain-containing protein, partial [Halovenus sp.]
DLSEIEVPVLQIVGEYAHIVPAESSKPFNETVGSEDTTLIEFPAGHIGISVSSKAHAKLWPEVAEWYAERDADAVTPPVSEGSAEQLTALRGIGPTYAGRLADAGIETPRELADYNPQELAEIAETSPSRTRAWIEQVVPVH